MKNKKTATLLAIFLGAFSVDLFYVKSITSGVLHLVVLWLAIPMFATFVIPLSIWIIIPFVVGIARGISFMQLGISDFNKKYNAITDTDKLEAEAKSYKDSKQLSFIAIAIMAGAIVVLFLFNPLSSGKGYIGQLANKNSNGNKNTNSMTMDERVEALENKVKSLENELEYCANYEDQETIEEDVSHLEIVVYDDVVPMVDELWDDFYY